MTSLFALLSLFIAVSAQAMLLTTNEVAAYLNGKTFESNEVLLEKIPETMHKVRFIFSGNKITIKRVFLDNSYKKAWLKINPPELYDLGAPFDEPTFQEYVRFPGNSFGLSLGSISYAQESHQQQQLDSHTPDFFKSAGYVIAQDRKYNFMIDVEGASSGTGFAAYWLDFYDNFPKIILSDDQEKVAQIEWKGRNTPKHTFVQVEQ